LKTAAVSIRHRHISKGAYLEFGNAKMALLADFNMRPGSIEVDPCSRGRVSRAAKDEPLQAPVVILRRCSPGLHAHCADGGVTSVQFARGVGSVQ